MAVRLSCSACDCVMHLADELRGKKIKCKSCGTVLSVPGAAAPTAELLSVRPLSSAPVRKPVLADASKAPTVKPRREVADDSNAEEPPRRRKRRSEPSSSLLLPICLAGGGVVAVALVIVLIVVMRSGPAAPVVPVVQNDGPPILNQQPAANPGGPAVPEKRNAPPLIADPPAGETLKGEQIYQKLLQSTVWIVASHNVAGVHHEQQAFAQVIPQPGGPQPGFPKPPNFGQPKAPGFGQPRFPKMPQPGFPNMPQPGLPNIPQPGLPNMPGMQNPNLGNFVPPADQKSSLRNTTWSGSETLANYGKLSFQFISDVGVVMFDADGTTRGSFIHKGNNVVLIFGGVVYNGDINGTKMSGNATNGQANWSWTVTRNAGAAPTNPPIGGVKSTGSGSLIDSKYRLVVTNVHVVGNCDTVTVYFPDFDAQGDPVAPRDVYNKKPGIQGRVVLREERADLALVQLDQLPEGVQPLTLAKAKAKPAQQVHSMGNPGASKNLWIYSPGKVRAQPVREQWKIFDDLDRKTHNYDAVKLETDSAINPGDSGGPLVDDRCALVGVAHGGSRVANNLSSFIEAGEVRQLLERYYQSKNDKLPQ